MPDQERAITSKHSDYMSYEDQWTKIRDVIEGQEAVKDKGQKYLPKLGGQDGSQYDAYKKRALFFNMTGRTLDGYQGMIFRKPPTMEVPDELEEIQDNISLENETIKGFGKRLVRETIATGRPGILVDFPRVDPESSTTEAEARRNGEFPYLTLYETEEIRNWYVDRENGDTKLKSLILHEDLENQEGYFGGDTMEQYRLLEINDEGIYVQHIWRRSVSDDDKDGWHKVEEVVPRMGGDPLEEIPFFFSGINNTTSRLPKPPLIDLANVNLSHYRSQADLEHGAHFTALPSITVTGADPDELAITVGPESANILENEDASVEMLEYTGKGLEQLQDVINSKEEMMSDLGARLVMNEENAQDAEGTVRLKQSGENSVIANIADTAGMSYTEALKFAARWISGGSNEEPEVNVSFNKDLLPFPMDHNMLKALMQMHQQNKITWETLINNLKRGEIVEEGKSVEDIKSQLESEATPNLGEL